jgi:hypothetical protein
MKEYVDPVSNLFCVTFDNSYLMESFFNEIQNLPQSNLTYIMRNYVDSKVKARYNSINKNEEDSNNYNPLDVIHATSTSDQYVKNERLFIYESGPFGDCVRRPIRFLEDRERKSCGLKTVLLNNLVIISKL